jgi:hypothetical protein
MLATIGACVSHQANQPDSPTAASSQSVADSLATDATPGSANLESPAVGTVQPDTKIITMNLEGQPTEVELKRFHQSPLSFTTYYPEGAFTPEMNSSDEGTGVRFYFSPTGKKNKAAYIHFFFPRGTNSLESVQDLLLGDQGLLVANHWELIDRTDIVSYPWAKEKLLYQHQENTERMVGAIYIGQAGGQTFYTLTHYPVEYGDGFEPRSNIVLENLQFEER